MEILGWALCQRQVAFLYSSMRNDSVCRAQTDGHTDTHMDGTENITSSANVGGKKASGATFISMVLIYRAHLCMLHDGLICVTFRLSVCLD